MVAIAGYAVVLVVGIRYVIRTVISVLRKAGYIASDFVTEVVEAVKSEIPIVETEAVEEISFVEMQHEVQKRLDDIKKSEAEKSIVEQEITPIKKSRVEGSTPAIKEPEVKQVQQEEVREEKPKKDAVEKIKDIFEV
jgi:hypothetical protein